MSKHTPGPWAVEIENGEVGGINGPDGYAVVKTDSGVYPPGLADACLIAAAPELLAELEHAEWQGWSEDGAVCPRCERYPPGDLQNLGGHAPGCSLAAALAKARGQP